MSATYTHVPHNMLTLEMVEDIVLEEKQKSEPLMILLSRFNNQKLSRVQNKFVKMQGYNYSGWIP